MQQQMPQIPLPSFGNPSKKPNKVNNNQKYTLLIGAVCVLLFFIALAGLLYPGGSSVNLGGTSIDTSLADLITPVTTPSFVVTNTVIPLTTPTAVASVPSLHTITTTQVETPTSIKTTATIVPLATPNPVYVPVVITVTRTVTVPVTTSPPIPTTIRISIPTTNPTTIQTISTISIPTTTFTTFPTTTSTTFSTNSSMIIQPIPPGSGSILITQLNLRDDYVTITNTGSSPVNMDGWRLTDSGAKHVFRFMGTVIPAGGTVTILSGPSASGGKWKPAAHYIWNNEGDTAYLYDSSNQLVSKLEKE
jgi:hypothetical protein